MAGALEPAGTVIVIKQGVGGVKMDTRMNKKGPNPEFAKPGMNTFMDLLSENFSQAKESTPIQKFHDHLRGMERRAQAGDIPGWQRFQNQFTVLADAANIDLEECLETKVRVRQIELTLLLKAGERALREAEKNEKEAAEAQVADEPEKGRILLAKAQKLIRLGHQLHDQLLAKTA